MISRVKDWAAGVCVEGRTSPGAAEVDVEDQVHVEQVLVDVASALKVGQWQTECIWIRIWSKHCWWNADVS